MGKIGKERERNPKSGYVHEQCSVFMTSIKSYSEHPRILIEWWETGSFIQNLDLPLLRVASWVVHLPMPCVQILPSYLSSENHTTNEFEKDNPGAQRSESQVFKEGSYQLDDP